MKIIKISVLVVFVSLATGCATTTPFSGPVPEKIVEVDATASEIFQASRQWIAENFRSARNVIQYQDAATNTVIGRGNLPESICIDPINNYLPIERSSAAICIAEASLDFVMKIEAKDGRMRVSVPSATYFEQAKRKDLPATQELMDVNSPKVLAFGDEIAQYITSGGSDW